MPISFVCPVCQTKMMVPNEAKGRKVKCPKCLTKTVAEAAVGPGINRQAIVLAGMLLAMVAFCVVMSYLHAN